MRFLFLCFFLVAQASFSQTNELRAYSTPSPELSGKLFNTQTGEFLSDEEIQKLKAEIPKFQYEPVYDIAGKVEKYLFDPEDPRKVILRNPALQPKVGEEFPEFVFQTVKGKEITTASMRGNWSLLFFKNSISTLHQVQFDQLLADLNEASTEVKIKAIAIFAYDEPVELLLENHPIDGVKNGNGFFQRFHLTSMPTVFLINPEGQIEAKFEGTKPIDFKSFLGK